jgi:hypothetical protein
LTHACLSLQSFAGDGTMAEGQIEAAGRADALHQFDSRDQRLIASHRGEGGQIASASAVPEACARFGAHPQVGKDFGARAGELPRQLSNLLTMGVP